MFGETDIIFKRYDRFESYLAKSDCYILKLSKDVFEEMLEEFEDFWDDVNIIAEERYRKMLEFKRENESPD